MPPNVPAEVRVLHEGKVAIFSEDRETDVKVKKGQVLVKYENDKEKTLTAVDHHDSDGAKTVSATGDAVFKVYCDEKEYPIILIVAASALVLPAVVESIGEEFPPPVISPSQPQ